MICRWSARSRERLDCPGARPLHRHIEGWVRHDRAIARWSGAFLDSWLAGGQADRLAILASAQSRPSRQGRLHQAVAFAL